jgi:hypothetical protein
MLEKVLGGPSRQPIRKYLANECAWILLTGRGFCCLRIFACEVVPGLHDGTGGMVIRRRPEVFDKMAIRNIQPASSNSVGARPDSAARHCGIGNACGYTLLRTEICRQESNSLVIAWEVGPCTHRLIHRQTRTHTGRTCSCDQQW